MREARQRRRAVRAAMPERCGNAVGPHGARGLAAAIARADARVARGHAPHASHGALGRGVERRRDWALAPDRGRGEVSDGRASGRSSAADGHRRRDAANEVRGCRGALHDASTAAGARRWNDVNVLALSRARRHRRQAELVGARRAGCRRNDPERRASRAPRRTGARAIEPRTRCARRLQRSGTLSPRRLRARDCAAAARQRPAARRPGRVRAAARATRVRARLLGSADRRIQRRPPWRGRRSSTVRRVAGDRRATVLLCEHARGATADRARSPGTRTCTRSG